MRKKLDLGSDKATIRMSEGWKQRLDNDLRKQGYNVQHSDSVHGLAVYPETPSPSFLEGSGHFVTEGPPRPTFSSVFEENYRLNWSLDERGSLACALYGATQTEVSTRAKFIFLVNVVESLIERKERVPQALDHVEHLIELTEKLVLEQSAKDSLLSNMKSLRNESINYACKKLISHYLNKKVYGSKKAPQFFHDCYSIRSSLLHTGKSTIEENMLPTVVNNLDMLVRDLLDGILQKSPTDRV